eukprot:gene1395-1763_t
MDALIAPPSKKPDLFKASDVIDINNLTINNHHEQESNSTTLTSNENEESLLDSLDNSDRKLAYFERILSLEAIPGADVIEIATVLGWKVIVKKGLYKVGDLVVYVEIDSRLPKWEYFINDRLDKCDFKIKTIKLRGQISQGYCIPIQQILLHPNRKVQAVYDDTDSNLIKEIVDIESKESVKYVIGENLTQFIGITKIVEQTHGGGRGANIFGKIISSNLRQFPTFLRKSDQSRIQNQPNYFTTYEDLVFEITEKLEGSSVTAFHYDGRTGVCSRNYELININDSDCEINKVLLKELNLLSRLAESGLNIALQGEIIGPKIQGNIYSLPKTMYKVFDIWMISEMRYATQEERLVIMDKLGLPWKEYGAPILGEISLKGKTLKEILEMADGFSQVPESKPKVLREGLVFKSKSVNYHNQIVSFKSISNQYLLKKK